MYVYANPSKLKLANAYYRPVLIKNPLTPIVSKSYLVSPYAYGNLYEDLILGVIL